MKNRIIKPEYEGNWKLPKELQKLEVLKNLIIKEWGDNVPKTLLSENSSSTKSIPNSKNQQSYEDTGIISFDDDDFFGWN